MSGAIDLRVDGLHFDGFEQGFADRAGLAFEAGLRAGLEGDALAERLRAADTRVLGALLLEGVDFSSPERLGQSLARAVLAEVAR